MKPPIETREAPPKIDDSGKVIKLLCPWCTPPHPIIPGVIYECGSTIKVSVVQTVYSGHGHKGKIRCLKCGGGVGPFVRHNNAFIHLVDCMPGTKVLAVMPEFSKLAKMVYKFPDPIKKLIEKYKGRASALDEIDTEGKKTGVVLGYFFWNEKA